MKFQIEKKCHLTAARASRIETDHGVIQTPVFMPVGTQGTVKFVKQDELIDIGAQIILGNTFHLYLRPGADLIEQAGGLHHFMNWPKPILTDSGGYQVYSLSQIRKITEDGVRFKSPVDGSAHFFSPEYAVDVQIKIGADIIMAFDECTPYPCDYEYAKKSMHLTHRWLDRCMKHMSVTRGSKAYSQALVPIVQGSTYSDLRRESARYVAEQGCEINAIGGLSVGEPAPIMYDMTAEVCQYLPEQSGRYLMGVGTPANLLECIAIGIDMFDCVLPTRNARHGTLYTEEGVINIKNAKWRSDFSPIDPSLPAPLSNQHSKAYLSHLFRVKEALGLQIASIHNLTFYLWLVGQARKHILKGTFLEWKTAMVERISRRL